MLDSVEGCSIPNTFCVIPMVKHPVHKIDKTSFHENHDVAVSPILDSFDTDDSIKEAM